MATLSELKAIFSHRSASEIAIEINGFTGFRTTKIEELTQEEIDRLYKIHTLREAENKDEKRKYISYILKIATDEGIHRPVMIEKYGKNEVDCWHNLNHWMLTKSTVKKPLYQCSLDELRLVYKQFCKLRDNNEKSAQKPFNRAWMRKGIKNQNLN
ncbi:MAG: hypothetical protein Q4A00_05685 [Flavobacteriaceae bacterium]|nr:hypothetical protein [Flavobacteriaceae bacterium]